jgi:hypothetical protein
MLIFYQSGHYYFKDNLKTAIAFEKALDNVSQKVKRYSIPPLYTHKESKLFFNPYNLLLREEAEKFIKIGKDIFSERVIDDENSFKDSELLKVLKGVLYYETALLGQLRQYPIDDDFIKAIEREKSLFDSFKKTVIEKCNEVELVGFNQRLGRYEEWLKNYYKNKGKTYQEAVNEVNKMKDYYRSVKGKIYPQEESDES